MSELISTLFLMCVAGIAGFYFGANQQFKDTAKQAIELGLAEWRANKDGDAVLCWRVLPRKSNPDAINDHPDKQSTTQPNER